MKRNSLSKLSYERILRLQQFRYHKRNQENYLTKKVSARRRILAPQVIDLYKSRNHRLLTDFLRKLRNAASKKCGATIDFKRTILITASGGILLLAEVDRLVQQFGKSSIKATYPPDTDQNYGEMPNIAMSVLQKIGLYRLLGYPEKEIKDYPNVSCWDSTQGEGADGSLIGLLLNKIDSTVTAETKRRLYRGAVEALANACEHAHMLKREDTLDIPDKRWWMFTAEMEGRLVILVCDLGAGIPRTIHKTQKPALLAKIFSLFAYNAKTDSDWIKTATLVKRTRTLAGHRGKGGTDLRMIVESEPDAFLSIFSNKGYFKLTEHSEQLKDRANSIMGTIVEWSIKV